ncbi:transcription initiation factor IIA large subunit-like [Salvia splendens]|uniref:transcription initiation factor IIA large subunit-like n=1 Tax=Salvia splendens TaxID=180675 RepID=UPI001C2542DB|nr:transcription initiation factor IIA large subunit-like [Salvia splendens]
MGSSATSKVYVNVIDDVISKVRDEFINNGGPGDGILDELQRLWELKMMHAGAIMGPIDRSSTQKGAGGGSITPNPVHDLNVPYEGTEEYETPTADLLFPPTPLQTPMQTPLPGTAQTPLPGMAHTPLPGAAQTPLPGNDSNPFYNIPTGGTPITPNDYASPNENSGVPDVRGGLGRPSQFMPPQSPWLNQRPHLDVNVAYNEGRKEGEMGAPHQPSTQDFFLANGKRKRDGYHPGYISQQDGASDSLSDESKVTERGIHQILGQEGKISVRITQLDGPVPNPYDDVLSTPNTYNYQGVVSEDYNIVNTPLPKEMLAATPAPVHNDIGDADDDDESLNEDDDDDDLDDVGQGEDVNSEHLVLSKFDKVTRTKSRWKCTLKDGIMRINNKDILFNKANGEFDF